MICESNTILSLIDFFQLMERKFNNNVMFFAQCIIYLQYVIAFSFDSSDNLSEGSMNMSVNTCDHVYFCV